MVRIEEQNDNRLDLTISPSPLNSLHYSLNPPVVAFIFTVIASIIRV